MASVIRPSKELGYEEFASQAIKFQEQEQARIQAELQAKQKEQERRIKQTKRVKRAPVRRVSNGKTIKSARARKKFEGVTEADITKGEQHLQTLAETQQAELEAIGKREYEIALEAKPTLAVDKPKLDVPPGVETVQAFAPEKKGIKDYDEYGQALSTWLEEYKEPLTRGKERFEATQELVSTEQKRIEDINKQQYDTALKKKPVLKGKSVSKYSEEFNKWAKDNEVILGRNYDDAKKIIEDSNIAVENRITSETKSDTDLALKQMASFSSQEGLGNRLISGKKSTYRSAYVKGWGFYDSPYFEGVYEELDPKTMIITVKHSTKKPKERISSKGYSLQKLEGEEKVLGTYKLGQDVNKSDFLTTKDGKQVLKSDAEIKKVFETIKSDEALYNPDRIEKGYLDLADQWGKREHPSVTSYRQTYKANVAEKLKEEADKRGPSGIAWYNPYTGKGSTGYTGGFYDSAPTKKITILDTMKADNVRLTDKGTWVRYDADVSGFKRKDYGITLTKEGEKYASDVELAKDKVIKKELKLDKDYFKDYSEAKTDIKKETIRQRYIQKKLELQKDYDKLDPLRLSEAKKATEIKALLKEGYSPATAANIFFTDVLMEPAGKREKDVKKLMGEGVSASEAAKIVLETKPTPKSLREKAEILEPVKMKDIATTPKTGVGAGALAGVKVGATSYFTDFSKFDTVPDVKDVKTGKDVSDIFYSSLVTKGKAIEVIGEGLVTGERVIGDISQPLLSRAERDIIGVTFSVKDSERKLKAFEKQTEAAKKASKIEEVNKELEALGKKENYKAHLRVYNANPTKENYDKVKPYLDIVEKIDQDKLAEYNTSIENYSAELARYKNSATKQQQQILKVQDISKKLEAKQKELSNLGKRVVEGDIDVHLGVIRAEKIPEDILKLRGELLEYTGMYTISKKQRRAYLGLPELKEKKTGFLENLRESRKGRFDFWFAPKQPKQTKKERYRTIPDVVISRDLVVSSYAGLSKFHRGVKESKDLWYVKGPQFLGIEIASVGLDVSKKASAFFGFAEKKTRQYAEFFDTVDFISSRERKTDIKKPTLLAELGKSVDRIIPDVKLSVEIKTRDTKDTFKKDTVKILDIDTSKTRFESSAKLFSEPFKSDTSLAGKTSDVLEGAENWFAGAKEYYKYKPAEATRNILMGAGFAAGISVVGSAVTAATLSKGAVGFIARKATTKTAKVGAGILFSGAYVIPTEIKAFQISDIKERQKFRGEKYIGELSAFTIGAGAFTLSSKGLGEVGFYDPRATYKGKIIKPPKGSKVYIPKTRQKEIYRVLSSRAKPYEKGVKAFVGDKLTYMEKLSKTPISELKRLRRLPAKDIEPFVFKTTNIKDLKLVGQTSSLDPSKYKIALEKGQKFTGRYYFEGVRVKPISYKIKGGYLPVRGATGRAKTSLQTLKLQVKGRKSIITVEQSDLFGVVKVKRGKFKEKIITSYAAKDKPLLPKPSQFLETTIQHPKRYTKLINKLTGEVRTVPYEKAKNIIKDFKYRVYKEPYVETKFLTRGGVEYKGIGGIKTTKGFKSGVVSDLAYTYKVKSLAKTQYAKFTKAQLSYYKRTPADIRVGVPRKGGRSVLTTFYEESPLTRKILQSEKAYALFNKRLLPKFVKAAKVIRSDRYGYKKGAVVGTKIWTGEKILLKGDPHYSLIRTFSKSPRTTFKYVYDINIRMKTSILQRKPVFLTKAQFKQYKFLGDVGAKTKLFKSKNVAFHDSLYQPKSTDRLKSIITHYEKNPKCGLKGQCENAVKELARFFEKQGVSRKKMQYLSIQTVANDGKTSSHVVLKVKNKYYDPTGTQYNFNKGRPSSVLKKLPTEYKVTSKQNIDAALEKSIFVPKKERVPLTQFEKLFSSKKAQQRIGFGPSLKKEIKQLSVTPEPKPQPSPVGKISPPELSLPSAKLPKTRLAQPKISFVSPLVIGGLKNLLDKTTYTQQKTIVVPVREKVGRLPSLLRLREITRARQDIGKTNIRQSYVSVSEYKLGETEVKTGTALDEGYIERTDIGFKPAIDVREIQKVKLEQLQKTQLTGVTGMAITAIPTMGLIPTLTPTFTRPPDGPPLPPVGVGGFGVGGRGRRIRRRGKGYGVKKFGVLDILKGIKPKEKSSLNFL